MNTDVINALRKYVDDYTNVYSFNGLVVKAAQKYLGETGFTSFNDLVRRAANKYTGGSRLSVNDAVRDALVQYTGSSSFSVGDLVNIAAVKYLTEPPAPANTTAPVVTGTPSVGSVLTCSTGTWSNSPTGYAYQWRADGEIIVSATSNTYTVQAGDAGKTLTCTVTATNAGGSASAVSNGVLIPAAKTYAEWRTHIATRQAASTSWSTNSGIAGPGTYRTTVATPTGSFFYGSSWMTFFRDSQGAVARLVQHGLLSEAQLTSLIGTEVLFVITAGPTSTRCESITRNGYTSSSYNGSPTTGYCPELSYWDPTLNKPMTLNPQAGTGPVDYAYPGW